MKATTHTPAVHTQPREHAVTCGECGAPMRLRIARHAKKPEMNNRPFYGCSRYPNCRATHGAHPDGAPLGIPGNLATKQARMRAHEAFDPLWKGKDPLMSRGGAYGWLESALGLKPGEGHIGYFDEAMCDRVVAVIAEARPLLVLHSELRRGLDRAFGRSPSATKLARLWLGEQLGLADSGFADSKFVRNLTLNESRLALAALQRREATCSTL